MGKKKLATLSLESIGSAHHLKQNWESGTNILSVKRKFTLNLLKFDF